jgi:predicted RNA-binding Zn-ribbon protein involved in translation (DUF1610 family)
MSQLEFSMGTEHVCPKCGLVYRCDEENCVGRPGERELECSNCAKYFMPHSSWGGHLARRDPVWAAKLARLNARMRSLDKPLAQIKPAEPSPCDLEAM